jgi:hypothetical protein
LAKSGKGGKSLKKYEVSNLLFFLGLMIALGALVTIVFRYYGNPNNTAPESREQGIVSEAMYPGGDIGVFYLGTRLFDANRQYRNRLEIPVTDDGFLRDLFDIPGVEEVTVDPKSIMIRKTPSVSWDSIRPRVQEIVMRHLHLHY